ncbi:MAG TPA: hypothetical protein VKH44_15515 [Pirellulaceae bacterium]|nr:hypothetical protein [Pirellulaceae bacterium]
MRLLLLLASLALLLQAGCACAPLGPKTLPTGEDKYSAKYD